MQKLLVVSRSTIYHNKSGGMETQLATLVNGLKKDFEVTILTTSKIQNQKSNIIYRKNGVKYIFLKKTIPGKNGYSLYENLFWQIPIKFKLDLLGFDFRKNASNYYKNRLKGDFEKIISQSSACQNFDITDEKLFSIFHGTALNGIKNRFRGAKGFKGVVRFIFLDLPSLLFEYKIRNPQFFSKCYKIILVSDSLKQDFCNQHKKYTDKLVVIKNGVDTNKFKVNFDKFIQKKLNVVYYGRIDFEKGILNFLEVAEKIPDTDFFVFGDGPNLHDFLNKSKTQNNVFYRGAVTNDQIALELRNMHIFLFLTNRREGMSMSLLESLASGVTVVTNQTLPGFSMGTGIINVSNISSVVKEIEKLKNNKNIMYEIIRKSRLIIEREYSNKTMVEKYLQILNI